MKTSHIFPDYVLGYPKHQGDDSRPHHIHKSKQQEPKPRPPDSIRDKLPFYGRLPKYSGPYQVGVLDLEIPARKPRHFSEIKREHRHALVLETVLVTICYPAHLDTPIEAKTRKARSQHNDRPTWLPRPRHWTVEGYAKFASLPVWPTMAFFMMTSILTKLPAYRNARLAEHWPEAGQSWHNRSQQPGTKRSQIRMTPGAPPANAPEKPKFPVIIFSHGLGGTKSCYSSVCGEFASHGFIVCAVEHRDGSGPRSIINHAPEGASALRRVESEALAEKKHGKDVRKNQNHDDIYFIFPEKDKYDTTPGHDIDYDLRESQMQLRCAEVDEAYYLLTEICAGRGTTLKAQNLRVPGAPGASTQGLGPIDFDTWRDRFHIGHVTMVGHSFGAATTVEMLRCSKKFNYISQGIIYDIWGMPVREATEDHHITAPLLGINSEAFMYWDANFHVAQQVVEEAQDAGQPAWLMTVRGTVHISQSDFCIMYPRIATHVMKTTMDPVRAVDVNIDASLDFLARTLHFEGEDDDQQVFRRNLPEKKYLDLDLVNKLPTEHKPAAKWTAVRLKVEHEGRKRLRPHAQKRYWERLRKMGQEEVWMHLAPGRSPPTSSDVGYDECEDVRREDPAEEHKSKATDSRI